MKTTFFSLLMSLLTLTACAACSTENDDPPINEDSETENTSHNPDEVDSISHNILVAYFSCTNTTREIAEDISEITGGELFRIEPTVAYTSADLDYNSDCRANREQNDRSARPAIKSMPGNLTDYGVIFLGYPIWWGEAPRIISTFLESGDFKGKILIPFCTSHSSGIGSSDKNLHTLAEDAIWKAGKRFSADASNDDVEKWIRSMNIDFNNKKYRQCELRKFPS